MISKTDIKLMPFTFIIAPMLLVSLTFVVMINYDEIIEEKELIVTLSCSELKEYTQIQLIESKLYFGHDVFLSYAEEMYYDSC